MKKIITFLFGSTLALSAIAANVSYSIETTTTLGKDKQQYLVTARISRISEQDGKITETLIQQPRVSTTLGSNAQMTVGSCVPKANVDALGISMDVFSPKTVNDYGWCIITITEDGHVLSKSASKVKFNEK